jgi:hypothetical protein
LGFLAVIVRQLFELIAGDDVAVGKAAFSSLVSMLNLYVHVKLPTFNMG